MEVGGKLKAVWKRKPLTLPAEAAVSLVGAWGKELGPL